MLPIIACLESEAWMVQSIVPLVRSFWLNAELYMAVRLEKQRSLALIICHANISFIALAPFGMAERTGKHSFLKTHIEILFKSQLLMVFGQSHFLLFQRGYIAIR